MSDEVVEYESGEYSVVNPIGEDVTAVILAGGPGLRMRPYTGPKCLVPLNGKPLLYHLIDHLRESGIVSVAVCAGYKADEVGFAVGQYPMAKDMSLRVVNSGEEVPMGHRLSDFAKKLDTPKALVCYGDTLGDVDLKEIWAICTDTDPAMVVSTIPLKSSLGIVRPGPESIHRLARIDEKPELPHLVNIGFIMAQSFTFLRLEQGDDIPSWVNRIAVEDRVDIYRHPGWHVTVNTEQERVEAEEFFSKR